MGLVMDLVHQDIGKWSFMIRRVFIHIDVCRQLLNRRGMVSGHPCPYDDDT